MATFTLTATQTVTVSGDIYSYCPKLIGIGWVKDLLVNDGDYLIPLAVANPSDTVRGVDDAIRFEILKSGNDYRLQFFNTQSLLIDKTLTIKLDDGNWHMLAYECRSDGEMSFVVDGNVVGNRSGTDTSGLSYGVAQTPHARVGGGKTWSPYLYVSDQAIKLYRWRVAKDTNIGLSWIRELMQIDKAALGIS